MGIAMSSLRSNALERVNWCKKSNCEAAIASLMALIVAFVVRWSFHPFLGSGIPTLTFMLATLWVALRYGYRWAIVELVGGFVVATYFFVEPYNSFAMPSTQDLFRMIYFFSIALLVICVFEKTNRDRYEAEKHAEEADALYRDLVALDQELRAQNSATAASWVQQCKGGGRSNYDAGKGGASSASHQTITS